MNVPARRRTRARGAEQESSPEGARRPWRTLRRFNLSDTERTRARIIWSPVPHAKLAMLIARDFDRPAAIHCVRRRKVCGGVWGVSTSCFFFSFFNFCGSRQNGFQTLCSLMFLIFLSSGVSEHERFTRGFPVKVFLVFFGRNYRDDPPGEIRPTHPRLICRARSSYSFRTSTQNMRLRCCAPCS